MRTWWLVAVLIACGDAGRAKDCDQLAAMLKPVGEMPPRYDEWSELGTHDWQNPDVRATVHQFVAPFRIAQSGRDPMARSLFPTVRTSFAGIDFGWTLYTPYTVAPRNDAFSYRRRPGRFAALRSVCPAISSD